MKKNYISPVSEIYDVTIADILTASLTLTDGAEDSYSYGGDDWVLG